MLVCVVHYPLFSLLICSYHIVWVLFCITIFSTHKKFPSSTEFWEFQELKYKISNSGIPISFSGLSWDWEEDVPECLGREKIWYPKNETGHADL